MKRHRWLSIGSLPHRKWAKRSRCNQCGTVREVGAGRVLYGIAGVMSALYTPCKSVRGAG